MDLKPLNSNVLIKPQEEKLSGGIILPDTMKKDKPQVGEVVAIGDDVALLKKGDTVIFKQFAPDILELEGLTFYVLSSDDILGIVTQ